MRLDGKRIWVTAAGAGIGRACAIAFRDAGAQVFATDRDEQSLLGLSGIEAFPIDGTDADAVVGFAARIGRLDGVVNCIGMVANGSMLDCTPPEWAASFRVNVDSFYHLLRAVLPGMTTSGGGSIVSIASVVSSIKGIANRAAYGASKAALIGMVKSVAADFAGHDIRCNAVCPGTVLSPSLQGRIDALAPSVGGMEAATAQFVARQPLGRLGTPDEIAALCLYLMSDAGRFVTGQALVVDGGMSM